MYPNRFCLNLKTRAIHITLLRATGCIEACPSYIAYITGILNYSSEQQLLKTVWKMEFRSWNSIGNFDRRIHFWLDGTTLQSHKYLTRGTCSTCLSRWIWNRLIFLWWKDGFKMVQIHISCMELRTSVYVDRGTTRHMLGWDSTLKDRCRIIFWLPATNILGHICPILNDFSSPTTCFHVFVLYRWTHFSWLLLLMSVPKRPWRYSTTMSYLGQVGDRVVETYMVWEVFLRM